MDKCPQGPTRDEVAKKVGLGSCRTYERHKGVVAEARGMFGETAAEIFTDGVTMRGDIPPVCDGGGFHHG